MTELAPSLSLQNRLISEAEQSATMNSKRFRSSLQTDSQLSPVLPRSLRAFFCFALPIFFPSLPGLSLFSRRQLRSCITIRAVAANLLFYRLIPPPLITETLTSTLESTPRSPQHPSGVTLVTPTQYAAYLKVL